MNNLFKGIVVCGLAGIMVGCGSTSGKPISVVTREDGSGTRGAFVELFEIKSDGVDNTIETAETTNSTSVMISTIQGNENAIGYISLGSLSDDVKGLKIDGVEATSANVKSGDYKVSRPFILCTNGDNLSDIGKDFMSYILSTSGQEIVSEQGFVSIDSTDTYKASKLSGSLTVGGSSSVVPLMEKLVESYRELNPDVEILVQQTDSTTGCSNTLDGVYEIGMVSRELKDEEASAGLKATVIANDGIAVIVNNENVVDELSVEQVKGIYTGEITDWDSIGE